MVLNYQEAVRRYGSAYRIRKAIENKELTRLRRDLYVVDSQIDPLAAVQARYPHAIFTMDCAFYYHGLTDVVPEIWHLATPRNATRINNPQVKQYFELPAYFGVGREQLTFNGVSLQVYDRERMLIELVRRQSSLPFDYYKEIVQSYRKLADELDMEKLEDYLEIISGRVNYYDILQKEIF